MNPFSYYTPTEVLFGKDTHHDVARLIKKHGANKVLLHYGSGSVIRSGLLDEIKKALDEGGIAYVELGGVVPNPHLGKVYEGIELGRQEGVDFILAVGGGSVIDSAKAIAYGLAEPEYDVWDLYEHTRNARSCLPVGSVLTIAAAGSEMSMGSVITNEKTNEKRAYDDDLSRPKFAVMNPELTKTLPDYQTQSGCADIMMHTMERYFTKDGQMEITDALAEALMRTVMDNAKILHENPQDDQARAEIMWAGSLAHNGLTGCGGDGGDWSTHMLEHELGGMFDVTHGAGLAAVWPSWARYVYRNDPARFARFATNVMGAEDQGDDEKTALKGIEALEDFYRQIDMPVNVKELGIDLSDAQIRELAERCSIACGGSSGSIGKLDRDDMEKIFIMARG